MNIFKRFDMEHYAMSILVVYTALHIHEEAYRHLHLWIGENWGVKGISFGRWLFHNAAFFTPALVIGLFIFLLNHRRFLVFAIGILFWGLMNGLEHIFFTIKNLAFAPGFWSGLLFLIIAVLGFRKLYQEKLFKLKILILGFFTNILFYWTLPMVLFITFSDHIGAIVGT